MIWDSSLVSRVKPYDEGYWTPVFPKLGTTWNVKMKTVHGEKDRTKLVFWHKLVLAGVLAGVHPWFWICLTSAFTWFVHFLHQIKSCQNKILWNLVNCYPVSLNTTPFLTLQLHSNWGWNMDYVIKLGLKYKVTSRKHFENFGYSQWEHFPNQVYNSNSTHTKYLDLQHYSYP